MCAKRGRHDLGITAVRCSPERGVPASSSPEYPAGPRHSFEGLFRAYYAAVFLIDDPVIRNYSIPFLNAPYASDIPAIHRHPLSVTESDLFDTSHKI